MSIDEIMMDVQSYVQSTVKSFHGQLMTDENLDKIRDKIAQNMHQYFNVGILDYVPIVDINHREELSELNKSVRTLSKYLDMVPVHTRETILKDIEDLKQRVIHLEQELATNPTALRVHLKNPQTFGPVMWTERGKYDH